MGGSSIKHTPRGIAEAAAGPPGTEAVHKPLEKEGAAACSLQQPLTAASVGGPIRWNGCEGKDTQWCLINKAHKTTMMIINKNTIKRA